MGGVGVGITKTLRGRNLALAFVRLTRTAWTFFKNCFLQGLKLVITKLFVKFGWKILTLSGLKSCDKMGHPWTIRGHLGLMTLKLNWLEAALKTLTYLLSLRNKTWNHGNQSGSPSFLRKILVRQVGVSIGWFKTTIDYEINVHCIACQLCIRVSKF